MEFSSEAFGDVSVLKMSARETYLLYIVMATWYNDMTYNIAHNCGLVQSKHHREEMLAAYQLVPQVVIAMRPFLQSHDGENI